MHVPDEHDIDLVPRREGVDPSPCAARPMVQEAEGVQGFQGGPGEPDGTGGVQAAKREVKTGETWGSRGYRLVQRGTGRVQGGLQGGPEGPGDIVGEQAWRDFQDMYAVGHYNTQNTPPRMIHITVEHMH